jgi:hypothetical protein
MANVKLGVPKEGEAASLVAGCICMISLGRIDSKVPKELELGPLVDDSNKFWPEVEVPLLDPLFPPPTYRSSDWAVVLTGKSAR